MRPSSSAILQYLEWKQWMIHLRWASKIDRAAYDSSERDADGEAWVGPAGWELAYPVQETVLYIC